MSLGKILTLVFVIIIGFFLLYRSQYAIEYNSCKISESNVSSLITRDGGSIVSTDHASVIHAKLSVVGYLDLKLRGSDFKNVKKEDPYNPVMYSSHTCGK